MCTKVLPNKKQFSSTFRNISGFTNELKNFSRFSHFKFSQNVYLFFTALFKYRVLLSKKITQFFLKIPSHSTFLAGMCCMCDGTRRHCERDLYGVIINSLLDGGSTQTILKLGNNAQLKDHVWGIVPILFNCAIDMDDLVQTSCNIRKVHHAQDTGSFKN